ncbi:Nucleosome assembly protein (NAP) [Corchorus olitorius]|uniref:Nucleosome assembly protein (NAP) n=1 Tax=Corchorus olitorius TaxID=93759 RepID=A0A1R3K0P1_9ROSI|nr:Nucleosome assembly protein (NAP) [Corchorus olitorius]
MGHEAINNVDMSELGDDLNDELARTGLINALMRLQNLAKKQADALQKLSPSVRKRVEILREIQGQRDELEEEQNKGFKLEFYFDINPYFKNTVLTKTYYMIDEDEPVLLEKAVGTKIEWFPGLKQKPKEEESKEAESVPETEDQKEKSSNNSEQISETEDKDGSKKSEPITASESEDHNEGSNNAEQISETENKEESKNSEPVTETDEDKEESKNGFEANTETEENEGSKNGEATTGIEDDEEKDYCLGLPFASN